MKRLMRSSVRVFVAAGFVALSVPASAQCLEWQVNVGNSTLEAGTIRSLAAYDEGAGARLFAGGSFDVAGNAHAVARWDGATWVGIDNFGGGKDARTLCVFDDGVQPVLVVAGEFVTSGPVASRNIASWNGTTWSGLGTGLNGIAHALCTFDDGTGPALYAAGSFTEAGGVNTFCIAKWDGATWSDPGCPAAAGGIVNALCVFDDGSGPALYAAGSFNTIGGVAANHVARFDGSSWSAVGTGLNGGQVMCLTVFDDGTGRALYAGGDFDTAGAATIYRVAKWDGATWSPLGFGVGGTVWSLTPWNDGSGPKLVAAGLFGSAGTTSANRVATWDGTEWNRLRTGIRSTPPNTVEHAYAALAHDEGLGHGSELFVAGLYSSADGAATNSIARYGPCTPLGQSYCFGDGSLPTPCPCALPNTVPNPSGGPDAGCANSFIGTGGKLIASGTQNPDTARLLVSDVAPIGFGLFISGNASDGAGVANGDGVRCAGGAFVRFGGQNAISGLMRYPNDSESWSLPLSQISGVTPGSGAVRHYQLLYRNALPGFCNPSTSNWTNAVTLIW
jgi:hypothetical protein